MEKTTSDNKYCVKRENLLEVPHLDWFEASIWSSFAGVVLFLEEINKSLFSHFGCKLQERFGNQRYFDSSRNDELGITVFHNVRNNVKNSPLFICLTGKFFRYARHVDFITWLIRFLNSIQDRDVFGEGQPETIRYYWRPTRIDASIDFISFSEPFVPYPRFKSISGSALREFTSVFRGNQLSKIFHGKDGCRITVYNKLFDDNDLEFMFRHPEYDGASSVWRLEFQFRKSEIKDLYKKNPFLFGTYQNIFNTVIGQAARRYQFDGLDIKPSLISCYLPRRKTTDEAALNHCLKKWFRIAKKVQQLEKVVYPGVGRPEYQKTLSENDLQKNLDFYEEYFKAVESEQ